MIVSETVLGRSENSISRVLEQMDNDRIVFETFCAPGEGRSEDLNKNDQPIEVTIVQQAFHVCEADGEQGLSWEEVEACEVFIF